MAYSIPNRVLVALDQSSQAAAAASYAAAVLPKDRIEVTLLHILPDLGGNLVGAWPTVAVTPLNAQDIREWLEQEKREMEAHLEKIRQEFISAGFKPEMVKSQVQDKDVGYARDIITEAEKGYGALIVGRTGMSRMKDIFMGSIATKLVGAMKNLPVWVVGGQPTTDKVLIAMDSSEGAMRAVDYVGAMLSGRHRVRICLFNVVRNLEHMGSFYSNYITEDISEKLNQDATRAMEPIFNEAATRLERAGLPAANISHKLAINAPSRAFAVVEEARAGGYGTIVVGRRGISKVEEFLLGRVSSKVVGQAAQAAVWVVN